MPLRNFWIIVFSLLASLACFLRAAHNRYASTLASAMSIVREEYLDEVSDRQLFEHAMNGMLRELDPYSSFIGPDEYILWKQEIDQEFIGIGIHIQQDPETKRPVVASPIVDGPAYHAGIRAGDAVLEIEGKDTQGMSTTEVAELIKGRPGSNVKLRILPHGSTEPLDVVVERMRVSIASVLGDLRNPDGSWIYVLEEAPQIGYIRIVNFGEQTVDELDRVLRDLSPGIEALILDVRGNEGGLLKAAVAVCDGFLERGLIVRESRRHNRRERVFRARSGNELIPMTMPLVVLVDRDSASASEIVAAALQDHKRATIIGQRSWGKGTVQRLMELEGGRSALRLTTATYTRPSGKNIHRNPDSNEDDDWGVQPDAGFRVELTPAEYDAWWRARQERDAVQLPSGSVSEGPPVSRQSEGLEPGATVGSGSRVEATTPTVPLDEVLRDRQLQRAIDYLKGQLAAAQKVASAA